jgi:hypothetical protein
MNIKFLRKLLTTRKQEIEEGKNLATRQPIYVVLDLQENITSKHSEYSPSTNYKGKGWTHGYMDTFLDGEEITFEESKKGMKEPVKVTRFYTDRVVSFFITSKGAHEYLKYQSHNLKMPYVYVFYSGYGNREMDQLLQNG